MPNQTFILCNLGKTESLTMLTTHLSLLTYLFAIVSVLVHYPIGRIFGQRSLLTGALVGVCISALLVAILANTFAGGIRPYILSSLVILSLASLWSLWKSWASLSWLVVLPYASITLAGLAFLYLNSPWDAFFESEKTVLGYNGHYTYYASQSIEMLNADYGSRLKALNLFPKEWATYHFYNTATQAITQALLPYPTLFSYFVSQAVLGTLVLLTFVEAIFLREKSILNKHLKASLFIIIGLTIFYDSMRWNLVTSGTISVFAVIHLVLALFEGNKKAMLLFGTLLAASALRLLPVVGPILLFMVLSDFRHIFKAGVGKVSDKFVNYLSQRYLNIALLLVLTAYVVATLMPTLFGMHNQYAKLGDGIGTYAWVQQLTSHILVTFVTDIFNANWLEYHEPPKMLFRVLTHPFFTYLFLLCILTVTAVFTFKLREEIKSFARLRIKLPMWIQLVTFIFFVAVFCFNIKFSVVSSFYAVTVFYGFLILRRSYNHKTINFCFSAIGFSYVLTFLYVSTGMNSITGPAAMAVYDLFLWGLILMIILKEWDYTKLSHGLVAIFLIISFHGKASSIFSYGIPTIKVPLSELSLHPRAYFVDQEGFLSKEAINLANGNGGMLEAYSAIFGARLRYSIGNNQRHINFPHVWTRDYKRSVMSRLKEKWKNYNFNE